MPMTPAERQAQYRARRAAAQPPPLVHFRRAADRRSRPQRWRDAVAMLVLLQADYAEWRATMPASLADTPTGQALAAMADLDLSELVGIDPPRGYGRD